MNKVTLKTALPFLILVGISILALFVPSLTNFDDGKYNGADIAWIIVATALVFLMTPGLAFFYGGMVNKKNVISNLGLYFTPLAAKFKYSKYNKRFSFTIYKARKFYLSSLLLYS